MKRAETCRCSLCNKLYISIPPYSCVREVYKLQSSLLHCTLARGRNNFCQLLNVPGIMVLGRLQYEAYSEIKYRFAVKKSSEV